MPSPASPITRIPYDILREIFKHCLPEYPLLQYPNTRTAPMLLCHICSSWRAVALASAPLWAHLRYCLTTVHAPKPVDDSHDVPVRIDFIERDLAFIRWWRANQGPIAPFLSLDVREGPRAATTQKLTGDGIDYLLEYIFSAQYLELDVFYWMLLYVRLLFGHPVVFPHLRTLRADAPQPYNEAFYQVVRRLPHDALPALRRLIIVNLSPPDGFSTPTHWAALTHIYLSVSMPLDFWHSFIRAVPRLRWGDFNITTTAPYISDTRPAPPPPECTLPALATLSVTVHTEPESGAMFPLSVLFTGLHLPSVRTLSLAAPGMQAWADRGALRELYVVLGSAPAVAALALEDNRFSVSDDAPVGPGPALRDAVLPVPIWHHAAELVRLQLTPPTPFFTYDADQDALLEIFVRALFSADSDSAWLDLRNEACPIRTIVIWSARGASQCLGARTMARIQEHVRGVRKVGLEFTSELAERVAAGTRMSWGVRV